MFTIIKVVAAGVALVSSVAAQSATTTSAADALPTVDLGYALHQASINVRQPTPQYGT